MEADNSQETRSSVRSGKHLYYLTLETLEVQGEVQIRKSHYNSSSCKAGNKFGSVFQRV